LCPGRPPRGLGLGLAVIAGLTDDLVIIERSGSGTELQMHFRLHAQQQVEDSPAGAPEPARA
jgi:hypothetical protein